jgi:hypothetical protein
MVSTQLRSWERGPGATVERKAVPGPKRRRRLGDVREFSRGTARRRSHVPCPRSRGVPFSLRSPSPSTTPDTGPALPRAPGLRTSPAANPVSRPTCSRHGPEGTPRPTSKRHRGWRFRRGEHPAGHGLLTPDRRHGGQNRDPPHGDDGAPRVDGTVDPGHDRAQRAPGVWTRAPLLRSAKRTLWRTAVRSAPHTGAPAPAF